MNGRLIYLMGPSGAGKDSLLREIHRASVRPRRIAKRFVTRNQTAADEHEVRISSSQFDMLEKAEAFAMSWRANGLAYGIPRHIETWMAQGHDVMVNGSRHYLAEARQRYPDLFAVLMTVETGELRRRLRARNRESAQEIEARLTRNAEFAAGLQGPLLYLDNSGSLIQTTESFLNFLGEKRKCA